MSIEVIEQLEKMPLHHVAEITHDMDVLRCPNGWLYRSYDERNATITAMAFVPEPVPKRSITITKEEQEYLQDQFK